VADVIQTGVIGSLVLCLPNAKEGIIVPICLSGIHAGLDAYLSILKSERDCLQHSLDTGEIVGICDEISAIYKCEFFWKQLSPLMDQVLPALVGGFFGSGDKVRGGGEYASTEQSWEVMSKGIDYYKDSYAKNAFSAFNLKSTEEVGSTFCRAFLGTSAPDSASFLDALLEPESPDQFFASFSEKVFSDATVPATSQYKVYFHIYAGKDEGAQYKVYLKNPPASSYYRSNPTVMVKNGYIARGDSADESIDFTAPAGYKELCVVVNTKEECGFKSATTDFGVNWVKDNYVEDQAEEDDIKTESDCISGTPSALSMLDLNLQDGVEETLNPEIAMNGIVRICANANPEAGVTSEDFVFCTGEEPEDDSKKECGAGFSCVDGKCEGTGDDAGTFQKKGSRWKDVGYCGDVSLRCWLDTDSVSDSLENLEAIEGTTSSILNERRGLIDNERLSLEAVQVLLSGIRARIKALLPKDLIVVEGVLSEKVVGILDDTDRVIGKSSLDENFEGADPVDVVGAGTNNDRAEALALKASVYRMLVGEGLKGGEKVAVEQREDNSDELNFDIDEESTEEPEEVGEADENCRDVIGRRIIELAREVKAENGISDASIESDGVADCFEELALMIAMRESGLRHCEDESNGCFDCGGGKLITGSDEKSTGVMQINIDAHDVDYEDFDKSVTYALEWVLWKWGYKVWKDGKEFNGVMYKGWEAAIRSYNGWGVGGDDNFVENVLKQRGGIEDRFPNACEEGEVEEVLVPKSDVSEVVEGESVSDGIVGIKVIFDRGDDYLFEYRWSEGGIEGKIMSDDSWLSFGSHETICDWSTKRDCDALGDDKFSYEGLLHGNIMDQGRLSWQGSWEKVVLYVRENKEPLGKTNDFKVEYLRE